VQYGRAELTFPDWDADKEKDKGQEEYDAAAQIKDIMYWLVSPLQHWSRDDLNPKRVLRWKEPNAYLSGSSLSVDGDYVSSWEGRIRTMVQLLSPTTWLDDAQTREVANRFAISPIVHHGVSPQYPPNALRHRSYVL